MALCSAALASFWPCDGCWAPDWAGGLVQDTIRPNAATSGRNLMSDRVIALPLVGLRVMGKASAEDCLLLYGSTSLQTGGTHPSVCLHPRPSRNPRIFR